MPWYDPRDAHLLAGVSVCYRNHGRILDGEQETEVIRKILKNITHQWIPDFRI
jgi:hypothetical protein